VTSNKGRTPVVPTAFERRVASACAKAAPSLPVSYDERLQTWRRACAIELGLPAQIDRNRRPGMSGRRGFGGEAVASVGRSGAQSRSATNPAYVPSIVALSAADFAAASPSLSRLASAIGIVGMAGGAGLIFTSMHEFRRADSAEKKLDAANNLAWGTQGLLYLAPTSRWAVLSGEGLGFAGAFMQTAVGLRRLQRGVATNDRNMFNVGLFDTVGGLLWLGWDLVGWQQPVLVALYTLLMIGREAYANKAALTALGRKLISWNQRRQARVSSAKVERSEFY
jgi:hypothetical protein